MARHIQELGDVFDGVVGYAQEAATIRVGGGVVGQARLPTHITHIPHLTHARTSHDERPRKSPLRFGIVMILILNDHDNTSNRSKALSKTHTQRAPFGIPSA